MLIKKPKKAPASALSYPFKPLEPGETCAVADGVIWARLQRPEPGEAMNVYLLADDEGWTLVDTGAGEEAIEEQLAWILERELDGAPVTRVIGTHMHPGHIGQAGLVCRRYGAALWMSRLEYLTARVLAADQPPAPEEAIGFFTAAGWSEAELRSFRERYGGFGRRMRALPETFVRIEDRDDVMIGGRVWRVITGGGHSPEHVCLWQPELKLFLSGDQVTPKARPAVAVWPTEPAADPLTDWLASCWRIMAAIPDDVITLPSRDAPFRGLHARLDEMLEDAHDRLERVKAALDEPRRVVDLFRAMYLREITEAERGRATRETLACLNNLKRKGRASYAVDNAGTAWFEIDHAAQEPGELEEL